MLEEILVLIGRGVFEISGIINVCIRLQCRITRSGMATGIGRLGGESGRPV